MLLFVRDKWAIECFPPTKLWSLLICEVQFDLRVDDFTATELAFLGGGSLKSEPHVTRCSCPWLWKPNARKKWNLCVFLFVCKHYKWWVLRCLEGVLRAWIWNLRNSSGSTLPEAGGGRDGEGEREPLEALAVGILVAYSLSVPPSPSPMCP